MIKQVFRLLTFAALIILVIISCKQQRTDIVIADFENESYGDWKSEGDAFGTRPAKGTLPGPYRGTVEGYLGERLANSYSGSSDSIESDISVSKGKLTSPVF